MTTKQPPKSRKWLYGVVLCVAAVVGALGRPELSSWLNGIAVAIQQSQTSSE